MKIWHRRHFWGVFLLIVGAVPWFGHWHWLMKVPGTGFVLLAVYLFWDLIPKRGGTD